MAQLRQGHQDLVDRDAAVVVVGPESAEAFARYWRTHDLPFVGLPDPRHVVLDRFGQEVKLLKLGRMPAQVIVDKQGVTRHAHYGDSMRDIPPNSELLALLDHLA
jgi:peroxiredoxin